jgi:Flp pilus assembly protein TadG
MKPMTNIRRKQRARNNQAGTVAVELAIVLPILALLLVGAIEFGSIVRDHQVLQNAAREGARFSALESNEIAGPSASTIEQRIKDRVIAYLANENITVSAGDIDVNQAYPMSIGALTIQGSCVTVTYNRPFLIPGAKNFFPSLSSLLTGSAVFRNFY